MKRGYSVLTKAQSFEKLVHDEAMSEAAKWRTFTT